MTTLPPALRPWSEALSMLDTSVQSSLATWLAPMRALFGPMAVPQSSHTGDPDGYDGITRRGRYDRLLLSEWAVALEVPEEFLRRAVMREHVFTRPAFRTPKGSTRSVALLDVGPMQLGAPRVAQLAALIVLDTRARDHGAKFSFGALQYPDAKPRELHRASLSAWTERITWAPAPSDIEPWRERLEDEDANDRWLIGPPSLLEAAGELRANLLAVEPTEHGGAPALQLTAHRRGRSTTSACVALPEADVCTKMLRAPLGPPVRVRRASEPVREHLGPISANGRRILLHGTDGSIAAHHVPNSSNEPPGKPKRVLPNPAAGDTLLGADISGRIIALTRLSNGTLSLCGSGLAGQRSVGSFFDIPFETPPSLARASRVRFSVHRANDRELWAWILDEEQQLWRLEMRLDPDYALRPDSKLDCAERGCRGFTRLTRERVAWHSLSQEQVLAPGARRDFEGVDPNTAVFGMRAAGYTDNEPMSVAWVEDGFVRVSPTEAGMAMSAPEGRIFGLAFDRIVSVNRPALLYVAESQKVFKRTGAATDQQLFAARAPITEIRHEVACDRIAWLAGSELGVYCLERQEVVLRMDLVAPTEDA